MMITMQARIIDELAGMITEANRKSRLNPHLVLATTQDDNWLVLYVQVDTSWRTLLVCSVQFWTEAVLLVYGNTKRERDKHPAHGNLRQPKDNRWHVAFTDDAGMLALFREFSRRLEEALDALAVEIASGDYDSLSEALAQADSVND